MDLDHARRLIQEAQDAPPFSDIILDLLRLVGQLDDAAARLRQRVEALERNQSPLRAIAREIPR